MTRQASKIRSCADDLRRLRSSLSTYRTSLNLAWQAEEMQRVNATLDRFDSDLRRLSSELDNIARDIEITADEIQREEAEKRAAILRAAAQKIGLGAKT